MKKLAMYSFYFVILSLLVTPVLAKGKYDLATQKGIYQYSNYTASKSLSVLILLDVKDKRAPEEKTGGLLDDQTLDEDWKRPMETMVTDILTKEMQKSGLIKLIPPTPENTDYRVHIEILSLYGGTKEREDASAIKGWFVPRTAIGTAKLRMILEDKTGREIINIDFLSTTEQEMRRMSNFHRGAIQNAALALRETVGQILKDLDNRMRIISRK